MESSGVFATYQLTTNYRSNQEILDFANVALDDIEANRFAQIQLQANSLDLPTEKSFTEAVTLDYRAYKAKKGFMEEFPILLRNPDSAVRRYIDARVAKGELVAFLSYSRAEVKMMEDAMREVYPTKHIANLVSDKVYDSNIFSLFIKKYWNDVKAVGVNSAAFTASQQIKSSIDTQGKSPKAVQAMEHGVRKLIDGWWLATAREETVWRQMFAAGQITSDQYFENLRDSLLNHEISHNSIRQRVVGMQNKERKQADMDGNPDMIVSTIHGVKGLEFPHTVVVHNYDNQMAEDMKRLYYVALTRARQSEFIASFGTVKNSKVEADYESIVEALRERDYRAQLRDQGLDLDAMAEDDVESALAALRTAREASDAQAAEERASALNAYDIAAQGPLPAGPTDASMASRGTVAGSSDEAPDEDGTAAQA